jgi:hypothetical protein
LDSIQINRLGRHQSFVAKYEGGERRLDVLEFITMARALKADPVKMTQKAPLARAQFFTHDLGAFCHRQHFAEGDIPREIFQTAIRRYDDALGWHVG